MELVDPFPDELSFCATKAKLVLNIGNSLSTLHTILSLPFSIYMGSTLEVGPSYPEAWPYGTGSLQ
ncbi:hypothetical protein Peur_016477 [Populus x canadensis]